MGSRLCRHAPQPVHSVVRTNDDGVTWVGIPAPTDGLDNPRSGSTLQSGVSEIRFADNLNGWVFGSDLWSTHDGGATWSRVTSGPGAASVVDLESSGGSVYVVTQQCSPEAPTCPSLLWRDSNASDAFQTVASFNLAPDDGSALPVLAIHDTTGYLVTAATSGGGATPGLLTSANGTTWSPEPDPCPAPLDEISIAPVDTVRAALLCSGEGAAGSTTKAVLATSVGGHIWIPEGSPPPSGGDGGILSAAHVSTLAIATSSAATQIYRSVKGGTTGRPHSFSTTAERGGATSASPTMGTGSQFMPRSGDIRTPRRAPRRRTPAPCTSLRTRGEPGPEWSSETKRGLARLRTHVLARCVCHPAIMAVEASAGAWRDRIGFGSCAIARERVERRGEGCAAALPPAP